MAKVVADSYVPLRPGFFETSKSAGVGITPTGEEEVKVAKSEAPVTTGAWCNREYLREEAE
jgi:hypothetical protein